MQLYSLYFAAIIVFACIATSPVFSQRNNRNRQQQGSYDNCTTRHQKINDLQVYYANSSNYRTNLLIFQAQMRCNKVYANFKKLSSANCITPENFYGTCVALSYCPQIANVFNTLNQRQAQQYVILSQRNCGTRSFNGDPVVCCSNPRPVEQATSRPQRQTQRPFFPTEGPDTSPTNPFLPPATTTTPAAPALDPKAASCRGPDSREGSCVPLVQCNALLSELQVRQTDTAFGNFLRASNRICGGTSTTVCCPSGNGIVKPVTPTPSIRNTGEIPLRLPTIEEGCGYTTKSFKKIVGGEVSQKGSWPWIALIGYDDELSATPFKCGGALITARHVVTAAHCIRKDLTFVRLGEHDLTIDTESRHVDIKVVRTEKHPSYTPRNGHSDIAILYLERNVEFTAFISPICLPTTPELRIKSYIKSTPFVTGWGKTMEGGTSANVLQELQIPIYNNAICRDRYEKQGRLFTENQFDAAVICAGVLSGGKDTCQGDSGGPLMIPEPYKGSVRFYLIGVVSYGIGCARPEIPGVYSSTQYFIDWIAEKVADTK